MLDASDDVLDLALRHEIGAAYGVELGSELFRTPLGGTDASLLLAADRLAVAIDDLRSRTGAVEHRTQTATDAAGADAILDAWVPLPERTPSPPRPLADLADAVMAWAASGGADASAIEIRASASAGRTMHVRRRIEVGEPIVFVPDRLLIREDRCGGVVDAIADAGLALASEHSKLAAWLAVEARAPHSPWRVYLDVLPQAFPELAVFRDRTHLDSLRGSSALAEVARIRATVASDWALLAARVPAMAEVSLAEFAWARGVTATRAFRLTIGECSARVLVPVADFANHARGATAWDHDAAAGGFSITAARPFEAGDEVHLSYGARCNRSMFVAYGFTLADNDENRVHLRLPAPERVHADLAARLLWKTPLGAAREVSLGACFDEDARRALSIARLSIASARELAQVLADNRLERKELRWIGEDNERAALDFLAAAARAALAAFSTPIAEDDALLADPALPPFARASIQLRRGEKQVLEAVIELAELASPLVAGASPWRLLRAAEHAPSRLCREYLMAVADDLLGHRW